MFDRYTERARRAIFFARYEASVYNSPCIEAEHLLLGLLREDKLLLSILPMGAPEDIRGRIEAVTPRAASPTSTSADLPLSDATRQALLFANEEAERLGERIIEASYLLLGLLRIQPAEGLLQPYGIDLATYRQAVARTLYLEQPPKPPASLALADTIAAIEALLERTGDLDALPAAAPEQRLRRKPWSRKEALGHLVDWATAHHQWFVLALTEPKLAVGGYPDDSWIAVERYADLPWRQVVDLWASLNRLLVHVLRQIPEDKLKLPCRIGIADPIPLERLVANYLQHMEDILGQILTRGQGA